MTKNDYAVILAAGKGTRMHSPKPKVLHTLLGESMLALVLEAVKGIFDNNIFIIVGQGAEEIQAAFPEQEFIMQAEQLGTGHALLQALPRLKEANADRVLVINGDSPLVTAEILRSFLDDGMEADLAFATIMLDDAASYGRVIRKEDSILGIVEAKDFDEARHGKPTGEVNAGLYNFKLAAIAPLLPRITNHNANGEYYITDLIALALENALAVKGCRMTEADGLLGVNSPLELAMSENLLAEKVCRKLLQNGVCLHNPASIRVSPLAQIEPGAEITGPCEIWGRTFIKAGAVIDSCCQISDTQIGASRILPFCHIRGAVIADGCSIGPFARLRPGTLLDENVHIGDFVELKQTHMHQGAKANHLSYLGDSEVGSATNIGAGTITCNYDGRQKHKTVLGNNAFIGSNTALVAPVTIGDGATIGAGSTITKNVNADELGIARCKQENIQWKKR